MAKYIRANALATKTNLEDVAFGGNVGIGTADPRAKLAVVGEAYFGGNVGIGTKGPNAKLDIHGDPAADIILRYMPAADAHMRLLADGDFGSVEVAGDRAFRVATNGRVRLAIDGSGNVGIGTPNPGAKLHVEGDLRAGRIEASSAHFGDIDLTGKVEGDTEAVFPHVQANTLEVIERIIARGNVGIGTTGPASRLEVQQAGATLGLVVFRDAAVNAGIKFDINDASDTLGYGDAFRHGIRTGTGESLLFRVGPSNNIVFDVKGNVGIGTPAPKAALEVNSGKEDAAAVLGISTPDAQDFLSLSGGRLNSPNPRIAWKRGRGALRFGTADSFGGQAFSEKMRITDTGKLAVMGEAYFGGNVGIGTAPQPAATLAIDGSLKVSGATFFGSTGRVTTGGTFWLGAVGYNTPLFLATRNTIRIAITPEGNVGIGKTAPTPAYKLDVAGPAHASSWPTSSDARFKTRVTGVTNALDKLERLRAVSFEWNELYQSLGRSTGHREIGLVAQDVEAVFPELVTTWGDEGYKAIDYGRLTAVLVEAVRELRDENVALKQRTGALEAAMERN